ncbi:DUF58 domain-containing protein [Laceyella putida]|uniref:DUF58 domain-containing protein n=1 Tax=Laceyella putida TaxID=110101 RepID=A0ABW2RQK7_9BACL
MNFSLLDAAFLMRLERLQLISRRFVRGVRTGKRRSEMAGSSLEFADYRAYCPGDDIRQIDWPAYARLGKWFLKTYLDEREMDVHFFLDCSLSMTWQNEAKGRLARQLVAALAYMALHHGDRVSLTAFRKSVFSTLRNQQGRSGVLRMFAALESLDYAGTGDINEALTEPQALPGRAGLSIVVTDGFSPSGYQEGLRRLQGAGQQVVLLHLTSAEEREPRYQGDLRLVDCETGQAKEVALSPAVLSMYRRMMKAYAEEMATWCFRRGILYAPIHAEETLETTLFTILRQTGLIRA